MKNLEECVFKTDILGHALTKDQKCYYCSGLDKKCKTYCGLKEEVKQSLMKKYNVDKYGDKE